MSDCRNRFAGTYFLSNRLFQSMLTLVLLAGCAARQPGDPLEPGFNIYSPEDDIEIGRQAAQEIEMQVEIVEDEQIQTYLTDLGRSLTRSAAARDYPYRFTLVNDPSINAFALPGGPIYIHTGVALAAVNEAQFVGVMAHEISHVALRHGTHQASTASLTQIPAVLAGAAIGQDSTLAQLGQLGLGFGVNSLMLRYSRDAEREADALGARLMAEAGYDPVEMASFFETLEAESGNGPPEFFSSHPSPGSRIENVRAELRTFPSATYDASTERFPQFKSRVQALPEPRRTASETRLEVPDPNSNAVRVFEGRGFSASYPEDWNVYGDAESDVVTIAPDGGVFQSASGESALAYGAVFSFFPAQQGSLAADTRALVSDLQSVNPGLEIQEGSGRIEIGGRPGLLTQLSGRSSVHGQIERVVVLTSEHPRGLFYVAFVALERDFEDFRPVFDVMRESVRF